MKTHATLIIALVLLVFTPLASATQVISITDTLLQTYEQTQPFSDVYSMSLAGTVFTAPVFQAVVESAADFGTVKVNQVVHYQTDWTVVDENGVSVNVSMRSFGEKNWGGISFRRWEAYVNGTHVFRFPDETVGVFGAGFTYRDSHILMYAENITARVPSDSNNNPIWSEGLFEGIRPEYTPSGGHRMVDVVVPKGLFYVHANDGHRAFDTENDTFSPYWIANVTHPPSWVFRTTYPDRSPETLRVLTQFETQASKADRVLLQDDGCEYDLLKDIIGVCPTISGIARFAIGLVPNFIAFFLDFVNPSWGDFFRMIGELAGEFVASYIFLLELMLLSPGKLFVVTVATASGAANLIGGLRGDIGTVLYLHVMIFKWLIIGVFWYFYVYWLLVKFAFEGIVKVVDTIGNYIPFT